MRSLMECSYMYTAVVEKAQKSFIFERIAPSGRCLLLVKLYPWIHWCKPLRDQGVTQWDPYNPS